MIARPEIRFPNKGFTLVEMLVVIAIIAVLVSILLPSLQKAKEHANLAACTSNAGQVGKLMESAIANEHLRMFPLGCHDCDYNNPNPQGNSSWWRLNTFKTVVPVVPETVGDAFSKPANDYGGSGLVCPASIDPWPFNDPWYTEAYIKSNYAMNYFICDHAEDVPARPFRNIAGHPHPNTTILFGESLWHYYAVDGWKGGDSYYYNPYFPNHHLNRLNYVMFDYSVKTLEKPEGEWDIETCDAPGNEGAGWPGSGGIAPHWCYYNRYGVAYTDELW